MLPTFQDEARLRSELAALKGLDSDLRDWRFFEPLRCQFLFSRARGDPEQSALLVTAVFVGTVQACLLGEFWAPSPGSHSAERVDCRHLARPCSLLYPPDRVPDLSRLRRLDAGHTLTITGAACNPLDACARLTEGADRVALVRFSSTRDPRNHAIKYLDFREDQLFLRSTYFEALENVTSHIHTPVGESIDAGGLVYTAGVAILRGPLEDGAPWWRNPPRIDVLWLGIPPNPVLDEQSQYARQEDKAAMAERVSRVFGWAAVNGVDALVMPPLGCGMCGCQHPALDVADVIREVARSYAQYVPQVCIASDHPAHSSPTWFDTFVRTVEEARPPIHRQRDLPVPQHVQQRKSAVALARKTERLQASRPRGPHQKVLGNVGGADRRDHHPLPLGVELLPALAVR